MDVKESKFYGDSEAEITDDIEKGAVEHTKERVVHYDVDAEGKSRVYPPPFRR